MSFGAPVTPAVQVLDEDGFVRDTEERYYVGEHLDISAVYDDKLDGPILSTNICQPRTRHLDWQLLGIAAAILNGRIAAGRRPAQLRYVTEYTEALHMGSGGRATPSLWIVDRMRDREPLLITYTCNPDDALNFQALLAAEKVAEGLNLLKYEWLEGTQAEYCQVQLAAPIWTLPKADRDAIRDGKKPPTMLAWLGQRPAETRHGDVEVRRMPA